MSNFGPMIRQKKIRSIDKRLSGKVKFLNYRKGYGFIIPDEEGAKDVFVHITAVHEAGLRGLETDQAVTYELKEENGKTCATNLALK